MAKLSEQLADLSVRAKHAEDAVSAAQKEAHDKVMARREQARAAATAAAEKVERNIKSAGDSVKSAGDAEQARAAATAAAEKVERNIKSAGDSVKSAGDAAAKKWTAFQTKISNDLQSIKEGIAQKKHDLDVRQAEKHADRLEWEAGLAVDYAIAAVEQAELAVLDAVAGRKEVAQNKRS